MNEFVKIPGYTNYLINKAGVVKNALSLKVLTSQVDKRGYTRYTLKSDKTRKFTKVGRFRLLALAFIPTDGNVDELVVNHIDGNKLNDALDNLEWVTQRRNVEHAGETGLSDSCHPVSVRDYLTGAVTKYASIVRVSEDLKLTYNELKLRFRKNDPARVYPELKQYRLGWEDTEWPIVDDVENSIDTWINGRMYLVKNIETGEVTEIKGKPALSDFVGYSVQTIFNRTKNIDDQPFFSPQWLVKNKSSIQEWRELKDPVSEREDVTGQQAVVVTDLNGKMKFFLSVGEVCRLFETENGTIKNRMKFPERWYQDHRFQSYQEYLLNNPPLTFDDVYRF